MPPHPISRRRSYTGSPAPGHRRIWHHAEHDPAARSAGSKKAAAALARRGRYQELRDNLRVKKVGLDGDPGGRRVICHNPVEAERDQTRREAQLAVIEEELQRIAATRTAVPRATHLAAVPRGCHRRPHDRASNRVTCRKLARG